MEYIKGPAPWTYEGSTWKEGAKFGDFKPNTQSGWKTFLRNIFSGKFSTDIEMLPYDSSTGKLILEPTPVTPPPGSGDTLDEPPELTPEDVPEIPDIFFP